MQGENLENKEPKVMKMSEEGEGTTRGTKYPLRRQGPRQVQKPKLSKFDMLQMRRLWALWEEIAQRQIRP